MLHSLTKMSIFMLPTLVIISYFRTNHVFLWFEYIMLSVFHKFLLNVTVSELSPVYFSASRIFVVLIFGRIH